MKKMTFEEQLKKKAEENKYADLTTLPTTIEAKIIGEPQFKNDARGNECCFIDLEMKDGKKVRQKYTATQYNELSIAIEKMGGMQLLKNTMNSWTKKRIGRAINDRFFPETKKTK